MPRFLEVAPSFVKKMESERIMVDDGLLNEAFLCFAEEMVSRHRDEASRLKQDEERILRQLRTKDYDSFLTEETLKQLLVRLQSNPTRAFLVAEDFQIETWDDESNRGVMILVLHDKTHNEHFRVWIKAGINEPLEVIRGEYVE